MSYIKALIGIGITLRWTKNSGLMLLTQISSMFSFYKSWKHPKTRGFLMFWWDADGTLACNRLAPFTVNAIIYLSGCHYFAGSAKDLPETSY